MKTLLGVTILAVMAAMSSAPITESYHYSAFGYMNQQSDQAEITTIVIDGFNHQRVDFPSGGGGVYYETSNIEFYFDDEHRVEGDFKYFQLHDPVHALVDSATNQLLYRLGKGRNGLEVRSQQPRRC